MAKPRRDLRDCATAYECRDRLPELAAWMGEDLLKQLSIWQGRRFARGQEYFDLYKPERGPLVATGVEGPPTDYTYVSRAEASERAWAQLVTWRQLISADQGEQIDRLQRDLGAGLEQSAAGEARPLPPR
jgi:hypothetical protein